MSQDLGSDYGRGQTLAEPQRSKVICRISLASYLGISHIPTPSTLSHIIEVLMLALHPSVLTLLARICFAAVLSRDKLACYQADSCGRQKQPQINKASAYPHWSTGASHRNNQHRSAKRRCLSTLITRSSSSVLPYHCLSKLLVALTSSLAIPSIVSGLCR